LNSDILKQSEVNVFKHTYDFLHYNNWTNTRLAKEVLCNIISIWQQKILRGTFYLRVLSSLLLSKCIRMHHINPILLGVVLKTSKYDESNCNVVPKSFLYEWMKHVKQPSENRYTAGIYTINFHKLEFLLSLWYIETIRSECF
jgi:hypothetical protein